MKLIAALAIAALATGCATVPPPVWTRAGHTDADLLRDTYRCDYESSVATPQNPREGLVEAIDRQMRKNAFAHRCMKANGWAQEQPPAPVRAVVAK